MEIETPLVLTGLSKFVKPTIIYGGIVPYLWMTISSAAGVETAWATAAVVAGALTIRSLVHRVNCRDGAQRPPNLGAADEAGQLF